MTSDTIKNAINDTADHAMQTADKASGNLKGAAQDAQGTASRVGDHAKHLADQASDAANDLYGRASDAVNKAAGSLPGTASEAMAKGQRAFETSGNQVANQVKKQPLEALLLAVAIGYLVGWATNRG